MRGKIKLINICIRHKCTNFLSDSKEIYCNSGKNVSKRIIKIRKSARNMDSSDLTSNIVHNIGNSKRRSFIPENLNDSSIWDDNLIENSVKSRNYEKRNLENDEKRNLQNNETKNSQNNETRNSQNDKTRNLQNDETRNSQNDKKSDNFYGETRFNELNMQMLSKNLHQQVFKNTAKKQDLPKEKINFLKDELEKFGIKFDDTACIPDIHIDLPELEGKNVEEHFDNIAKSQSRPYVKIIEKILNKIPEMPDKWLLQEGWTRYSSDKVEIVDYPLENGMIFDVEVCMKEGPLPTLATAVTSEAWYGWVSKSLVDGISIPAESRSFTPELLVPIESTKHEYGKKLNDHHKQPKIIVGHNVCYDRARIKEQYWLNSTGTRFLDTMSLHVSVSGMNSYQRSLLLTKKERDSDYEEWQNSTSLNNLSDVYQLYCGKKHEKEARNVFVEGTLVDVREKFNELMHYCASDVIVTHEILQKLFPHFQERFPHSVTLAGMLELSTAYLPVNSNWKRYIEESELAFEDLNYEGKVSLSKRADEVCKLMHNDKYKEDLWMWDQDWSTQPLKAKTVISKKVLKNEVEKLNQEEVEKSDFQKYLTDEEDEPDPLEKEFAYLHDTKHLLPAKPPHMPGYPAWYRKLCMKEREDNWMHGPQHISTAMKLVPKLLNLTWENYPLHHIKEHGWGFIVPYNENPDIDTKVPLKQLLAQCPLPTESLCHPDTTYAMDTLDKDVQNELHKTEFWRNKKVKPKKKSAEQTFYKGTGVWCNVNIDNCCWFVKLPHKNGPNLNVGNPLAKDFLNKFSENVLAGLDSSATEVLKIAKMVSYWRNNRDRIMSQLVIWLNEESLPFSLRKTARYTSYGAIIPQVVVTGTLTRRATEPTWMTASNSHVERVGSELRAMVQAPPEYNIVGADVDSQELWIASLVGDAYCAGIHGATPFGWMTLIGSKSRGTDMHSVTANAIGISRDQAKIINYARIYGAGQKFAERLLKQFNPSMKDSEALAKSKKMFEITKGKKLYRLKNEFIGDDLDDRSYTSWEAYKLAKLYGKSVGEMFGTGKWSSGSESDMFNRLEEIAGSEYPVTPFLNSRLSRALEVGADEKDKYLPTKINWVVQSGAVDFLHLMLVSMRWLMRDNARFCLSFHDEIRYMVPTKYKYNAALAMHVTNLLTRSFCASKLGINDLPMSVAFFASVEVDTVLRKEASIDCKTPSNPHGLENGYGIVPGESLDVWNALEKSGGSLGPWYMAQMKKKLKKN